MTILDFGTRSSVSADAPAHRRDPRRGIIAVQLHDALWRVTRPSGEVAGYVERTDDARFRAKRMLPSRRSFVAVGEFWRFDDALDVFATG
ncbi:hypothetical protein QT381_15230 [Galbitalea sp. SE-J8]|uniref:hypothetical protein n=1 Tax=Galbitalea sp. SE-J8 TaxID=3054952 RepID=UPI00259CF7EE|nr:hypothetical protein [Galbitalea sp. SE-J8]MDM4764354.1 hypothetical protein [Galbitalea sp. SE-J8]